MPKGRGIVIVPMREIPPINRVEGDPLPCFKDVPGKTIVMDLVTKIELGQETCRQDSNHKGKGKEPKEAKLHPKVNSGDVVIYRADFPARPEILNRAEMVTQSTTL
jgi:hypothetical protein